LEREMEELRNFEMVGWETGCSNETQFGNASDAEDKEGHNG